MEGNPLNWETLLIYVIYGGMCMLPMVINIVEDIKLALFGNQKSDIYLPRGKDTGFAGGECCN